MDDKDPLEHDIVTTEKGKSSHESQNKPPLQSKRNGKARYE